MSAFTSQRIFGGGAHQDISRALLIEPTDSWAQRQHGRLLRSLGCIREAIASGIKATDSDPLSNIAWEALGDTYAAAGEFPAASVAYHRALDLEPDSFFASDGLGVIELLMGRVEKAIAKQAQIAAFAAITPERWLFG